MEINENWVSFWFFINEKIVVLGKKRNTFRIKLSFLFELELWICMISREM